MCTVKVEEGLAPASVNVTCSKTGKPIIKINKYGQYCEDNCGIFFDKRFYKETMELINGWLG